MNLPYFELIYKYFEHFYTAATTLKAIAKRL